MNQDDQAYLQSLDILVKGGEHAGNRGRRGEFRN